MKLKSKKQGTGTFSNIFYDAEKEARAKKLGLWKQANPTPPWEFRKMLKLI